MSFEIEKGIPIPPQLGRTPRLSLVLREMEVNDSVFIEGKNTSYSCAFTTPVQKSTGRKFTSRTMDGGVRIWRVE